jgi:hypothetical protein
MSNKTGRGLHRQIPRQGRRHIQTDAARPSAAIVCIGTFSAKLQMRQPWAQHLFFSEN